MIRPIRLAALALIASTGLTIVASTGAAGSDHRGAASSTTLSAAPNTTTLRGYEHMVVDTPLARVFVSEGPADAVAVLSMFGKPLGTIPNITGANGIALNDDGSTVFVTEPSLDAVVAIDAATLEVSATYHLPKDSNPLAVTSADGLLWFGQQLAAGDTIGAIDPATGTVYPDLAAPVDGGGAGPTLLGSSPALPGTIIGAFNDSATYGLYHVTGGTEPTATLVTTAAPGSYAPTFAFTPDGTGIWVGVKAPYQQIELSTTDLSEIDSRQTAAYPDASAVRADGMLAGGVSDTGAEVFLFVPGQTALYGTYTFDPSGSSWILDDGLAFGPQHLFVVTGESEHGPCEFHWLVPKRRPHIFIRATPRLSDYGATKTITAHVTNPGANRTVSIYAQPAGQARRLIGSGTLSQTGYVTVHTTTTRFTHFTAVLAGDAQTLTVSATTTSLTRAGVSDWLQDYYASSGTYRLFHVTTNPTERTLVSPNHHGDCVTFELQFRYAGQPWGYDESTRCGRLSTSSHQWVTLVGTHHIGEMVRIRTRFPGAFPNAPQDGLWRYLRFTK